MNDFVKSPLNYTGGKHKLLPQLVPLISPPPPHLGNINTFVDLFTGGGNVVANVKANKRIANDVNVPLIELFEKFQSLNIEELLNYINNTISEWKLSMTNQEAYNLFREKYNQSEYKNSLDLFILICYSFNHQIRFNSKGEFNMPFGKNRCQYNSNIEKNLINFHKAIKDIIFTTNSFEKLKTDLLTENDYVYYDPPYLITCASYNERDGWTETDERNLLLLLDNLNKRNIRFGLSNVLTNKGKRNEILAEWCKKYNVHHLNNTYNNCSYHAKDKTSITEEVFITNY